MRTCDTGNVRPLLAVPLAAAAAGAGCLAWGAGIEVRRYTLRRATLPVLPRGADPVRVLHVTDTHLTPGQAGKIAWVRDLARLGPDFVVNTGDTLAHPEAVPAAMDMLEPLFDFPGAFVFGSNDYYAPRLKNPVRYLLPDTGRRVLGPTLPWDDLRDGMAAAGWTHLTHRRAQVKIGPLEVELRGIDDSHLGFDRYGLVAGPADADADLRLGLMHSPEPRNLRAFSDDGFDLLLAGHTHGGQLRLPGYGALVTNCGLPPAFARGPFRVGDLAAGRPGRTESGAHVHVSAGLGTSPYAPVRFACVPEATLLTLVAAPLD